MRRVVLPVVVFLLVSVGATWQSLSNPDPERPRERTPVDVDRHRSGASHEGEAATVEADRDLPGGSVAGGAFRHEAPAPEWTRDPRAVVAVEAAGRGNPWVHFRDGREVPTDHMGPEELAGLMRRREARPKAMATGDFDEDGVPDLLAAYERGTGRSGGLMVLHRGNVDAIYPNAPEAKERKAKGTFTDAPFLPEARVVPLPVKPKFVGAGDFDADGHWDVVTSAEGQSALYWMPGDGKGGFGQPKKIDLPGRATALVTGGINRRDGLTDVVVGVTGPGGHQLLVFEGPEGALAREPEVFPLSATATALALDRLDEESPVDLAVAAGRHLVVIHGRDRKLSLDEGQRAKVEPAVVDRIPLPFTVAGMATGNFDADRGRDVALVSKKGDLYQASIRSLLESFRDGADLSETLGESRYQASGVDELMRVKSSSLPGDDLLVFNRQNRRLDLIMRSEGRPDAGSMEGRQGVSESGATTNVAKPPARLQSNRTRLDVRGVPVSVLPLRMRPRALSGLVVLADTPESLTVVPLGGILIPVNSVADPGDGICNESECTLREAINAANLNSGADTITFNIPGPGPHVIEPGSPLPPLTESVDIDGETQPGFVSAPVIVLDGTSATLMDPDADGFFLGSGFFSIGALSIINFGGDGIVSGGAASAFIIAGNYIGIDPTGAVAPNGRGVFMGNGDNGSIVGMTGPYGRNVISGNVGDGIGIDDASGSAGDIFITGNFIGLTPSGAPAGNGRFGINVGSGNVQIGGTGPLERNVISYNNSDGIFFGGTATVAGALIQGNFIGTIPSGVGCAGNEARGINFDFAAGVGSYTIGGTTPGARNVISCNLGQGVRISNTSGTLIQGNYIGLGETGGPLPNNLSGVFLALASNTTIGGATPAARNIISANMQTGVSISGGELNTVAGNFIGTDVNGSSALPNHTGVHISGGALNNVIGVATGGNVISGNFTTGVYIQQGALANWVSNNLIGVAADGISPLGNGGIGVTIFDAATANLVGGISEEYQNTIAFNGSAGITVTGDATGNGFLVNSIFDNGDLGIDLGGDGVTINDPQDPDVGPNNLQNYPVLTLALSTGGSLQVEGTLDSTPNRDFTIRVYSSPACDPSGYGEGKNYIGSFVVNTNASGLATFRETFTGGVSFGDAVTATADDSGETSEFSECRNAVGIPPPPVSGVAWDVDNGPPPAPESISWDPAPGATSYHLYAGTRSTMAGLTSQTADSCEALVLPATGFTLPPGAGVPTGHLLWVLVTAEGPYGEGTVQPGSNGPRLLNSTGECGDSCAHDRCDVGGPLVPACDLCASIVCDKDPACCTTAWSATCVQEVRTVCRNLACAESQGQCAHDLCDSGSGGAPLVPGCDSPPLPVSCTAAICQVDPHCCQQVWDDACVAKVSSVCGYNCL